MWASTSGGSSVNRVSKEEEEEEGCCDVFSGVGTAATVVLAATVPAFETLPRASKYFDMHQPSRPSSGSAGCAASLATWGWGAIKRGLLPEGGGFFFFSSAAAACEAEDDDDGATGFALGSALDFFG